MKLLGILLLLLSISKLFLAKIIRGYTFFTDFSISSEEAENLCKYFIGFILADGLIGLICGLFIIFI